MKKLYKYLGSELFQKVFPSKGFLRLKASHPQDFNDPYELFLTIRTDGVSPEILAYYHETVGNVPQYPTVCFSARPDVVPMWAHYARECTGLVIECNENEILKAYPEAKIAGVKYSKVSITIDPDQVAYAYTTAKPRHTYHLRSAAFDAAYFTKSKYWSYESERRFVTGTDNVTTQGGVMTIAFPIDYVSAIIVGPKINRKIAKQIYKFGTKTGLNCYQMHIARNSMRSFFTDQKGQSFIFNGKKLIQAENSCVSCNEPLEYDTEGKCHWCAVSEAHKENAAFRNPMRQLAHLGLLEDYLRSASSIK